MGPSASNLIVHPVNLDVADNEKLALLSPTAVFSALFAFLAASLRSRVALQIEILALRHQLCVLERSVKRPRLSALDRWLWVWLCRHWSGWRSRIRLVKPATIIAWQYRRFRLFWTWKCRHGHPGRPALALELRQLFGVSVVRIHSGVRPRFTASCSSSALKSANRRSASIWCARTELHRRVGEPF
jgi:hypothetical protein